MTANAPARTARVARARIALAVTVALLAAVDLSLKAWAGGALADGQTVDLGPLQLRLVFNSGVAFSLGATLPAGVVLGVTGLIIVALAVFAWWATRTATLPARLALAAILAGAVANLLDRAADGVVTDYLHTGWFPTFNLADVFITAGAAALVLVSLTGSDRAEDPV
ncbi:signal peptidase II [Georgenia muralis]|uniref:Lipoprotein signal peptidase n=1 Tax=Georgenia muralis TaxID=154117 RepID=A0A3N4ZN73_9MICO|nr:signal peptidase II [Georgenia muralis]RPF27158.1 signal peptidase II [Georgenia muralis]